MRVHTDPELIAGGEIYELPQYLYRVHCAIHLGTGTFGWPVSPVYITQIFWSGHHGIDISAYVNTFANYAEETVDFEP